MKLIGFILTYSLIWLLHLFPERLLYLFSDLLYLLGYHVAGYRKKVVFENLENVFPGRSPDEIRKTARKFYHHLSDLILEAAVSQFYTEKQALKRIKFKNPELLEDLHRKGKQVMAVTAHYGNWEYIPILSLYTDLKTVAIYKPLSNRHFDKLITKNRTRFGLEVSPMEKIGRKLIGYYRDKVPSLTFFLSDQSPVFEQIQYWTKFLGQDTPVYLGVEKLARKFDGAVVFMKIKKVSRGRYETEVDLVCEEPGDLKPYEITERHVKILEELIRESPEYWLWSHRRWKHSYERYLQEKGT